MAAPKKPVPAAPKKRIDKVIDAPISPFIKIVDKLMEKYPGELSALPPEGRDRIDRFFGGKNDPVTGKPGGAKIQVPLIHPVLGSLVHVGLGLQPTRGATAEGALTRTGIKPGPGISRDQFITHLRNMSKDTPQQKAILRQTPTAKAVRAKYPPGTRVFTHKGDKVPIAHGTVQRHVPATNAQGGHLTIKMDDGKIARLSPSQVLKA